MNISIIMFFILDQVTLLAGTLLQHFLVPNTAPLRAACSGAAALVLVLLLAVVRA